MEIDAENPGERYDKILRKYYLGKPIEERWKTYRKLKATGELRVSTGPVCPSCLLITDTIWDRDEDGIECSYCR